MTVVYVVLVEDRAQDNGVQVDSVHSNPQTAEDRVDELNNKSTLISAHLEEHAVS